MLDAAARCRCRPRRRASRTRSSPGTGSNFGTALTDYSEQFVRSFLYAGLATILALLIGYPLAYFIARKGGRWKDLLIGLVVIPFFTSFLIRTIAWTSILNDNGAITHFFQHIFGSDVPLPRDAERGRSVASPTTSCRS